MYLNTRVVEPEPDEYSAGTVVEAVIPFEVFSIPLKLRVVSFVQETGFVNETLIEIIKNQSL